ncbi:MAG: amidohydrolase family protein [Pirellulales bacterium]
MAGSDWPVCLLAAEYAEVWDIVEQKIAQLSAAEQFAIRGGTASRFYGVRQEL